MKLNQKELEQLERLAVVAFTRYEYLKGKMTEEEAVKDTFRKSFENGYSVGYGHGTKDFDKQLRIYRNKKKPPL